MPRRKVVSINSRPEDSAWDASGLRALMRAAGLEAEHVAGVAGVRAETARRWLKGRTVPNMVEGKAIAALLRVDLADLLTGRTAGASITSSSDRAAKR